MTTRASLLALVATALVCMCALAPGASAKPASFKAWSARWQKTLGTSFGAEATACEHGSNSQQGQCFVKSTLSTYQTIDPLFASGIAKIEAGQTPACRKAISAYFVEFRKTATTVQTYLRAHASTATLTQIKSDFDRAPYTTLDALVKTADTRAIRVCG